MCEAIDSDTRALLMRSGVHALFVSMLSDPKVPAKKLKSVYQASAYLLRSPCHRS